MLLKLGTINVHEKKNKMTSLVLLHYNSFAVGAVLIGTLSSGNADGDADAETGEKIGERTPL